MKEKFIQKIKNGAIRAYRDHGLFPSVTIAQAILESGYGKYHIENNLFGIKKGNWTGPTKALKTVEYINGERVELVDEFRVYDSFEESVEDYVKLLTSLSRYEGVVKASSPEEACRRLQEAGYATDPQYPDKLIQIIRENNLKRFDILEMVDDWAKEAWNWAKELGITDGTAPRSNCTRQEVVTMVYRFWIRLSGAEVRSGK